MKKSMLSPATVAWIVLMVLTLSGFISAEVGAMKSVSVTVIMLLSALKARIVLYHFMELAELPLPVRIFFNAWLIVCVVIIVGLFLLSLYVSPR